MHLKFVKIHFFLKKWQEIFTKQKNIADIKRINDHETRVLLNEMNED